LPVAIIKVPDSATVLVNKAAVPIVVEASVLFLVKAGTAPVLEAVSITWKRSTGAEVAAAGLLFSIALTVNESLTPLKDKPTIDTVPEVVESEAAPKSEPEAAVVLRVN
jgi:hypothetical protein